jgi:hypothetical protein
LAVASLCHPVDIQEFISTFLEKAGDRPSRTSRNFFSDMRTPMGGKAIELIAPQVSSGEIHETHKSLAT